MWSGKTCLKFCVKEIQDGWSVGTWCFKNLTIETILKRAFAIEKNALKKVEMN